MAPLWRLTRNPYAKRLHAVLDSLGVTLSVLRVYVRPLSGPTAPDPDTVELRCHDPAALEATFRDADALERADHVVAAYDDGTRVGSVLVTVGGPVYVDPLHREFDHGGAYVWRLYVDPDSRGRGLGRLLVRAALGAAVETSESADCATALIAPDNVPSQRVFESAGFEPQRELRYLRLPGIERRLSRPLD